MAMSDPFSATAELGYKGASSLGENILGIAGLYAQQKQKQREMQMEQKQKKTELLATLATKGLISATTLPKEPQTVEDFQALATQSGRELAAKEPETARRLLEASGIKIPKRPRTFSIEGLGEFYQTGTGRNIGDVSDLTPEQQLQGRALARKIYGVRGAEYGLPSVYEEMRGGKSIDQIEDSLRYAGQSKEFSGSVRDATQTIMMKAGNEQTQRTMDYIDDYLSKGDTEGVQSQ